MRVLSCNAHLYKGSNPDFFSRSLVYKDDERAAAILQRADGEFDVMGFTEVWADTMRDRFSAALANYASYRPQADVGLIKRTLAGSPGMVLSVRGDNSSYVDGPHFDFFENMVQADSLAYKGVSYGVMVIGGTHVGVLQTHAQASYTGTEARDSAARDKQIEQTLIPAIKKIQGWFDTNHRSKGPIVLLGDLNIVGETDEYTWISTKLDELGFHDCWTQTNSGKSGYTYVPGDNPLVLRWDDTQTKPQRLDYVFLAPGDSGAQCQKMEVLSDWKLASGNGGIDVSDHYPVSATIT